MNSRVVVITPAFNEADHIVDLCKSIDDQTLSPVQWIVVDDGSDDNTAELARAETADLDYVKVITHSSDERSYAAKVRAFEYGRSQLGDLEYDYLMCMDADVLPPPNYVEEIVASFEADPTLGVCGGVYTDIVDGRPVVNDPGGDHVPGAGQAFRREVYEAIGGYHGMPYGGEDSIAPMAARMHGWRTEARRDLVLEHRRRMGTGGDVGPLKAEFRKGRQDYDMGLHPLFEIVKLTGRLPRPPVVFGALWRAVGYLRGVVGRERHAPADVIEFARREQLRRIKLARN